MAIITHTEIRLPADRSRKKPKGLSLSRSVTPLGPNSTTHIESLESEVVNRFGPGNMYSNTAKRNDAVQLPTLGASGITVTNYQVSANRAAALNKALAKLKDTRIDVAVFLAELPETLQMFLNGGKVIVKAFKATSRKEKQLRNLYDRLRRSAEGKNRRKARRDKARLSKFDLDKEIASLWLGWRYGIMPLVYDAQGLLDELKRPKEAKGDIIRVKTSSKLSHQQDLPGYMLISAVPAAMRKETFDFTVVHSVCLTCVVEKPRTMTQLGFTNGLSVLYEMTPLSFVADWWLNIGETLSVIDAGTGTSFVSGTISEKREVRRSISGGTHFFTLGGPTTTTTWQPAESYSKTYSRAVLSELPTPQFYVSNNMNTLRFVDAFALLKTILFSKK